MRGPAGSQFKRAGLWPAFLILALLGCGGGEESAMAAVGGAQAGEQAGERAVPEALAGMNEAWTGDLDGMVERRVIRALVTYNNTNFFFDGPTPKGISYESLTRFEEKLNKDLGTRYLKVHIVFIPTRRDRLIPALREGLGDVASANLTITPERQELVDFSTPSYKGVDEVIVTGPKAPAIASLDDLAGQEVWVRASSSYFDSLQRLNESLRERGLDPVVIRQAEEQLETEDLLEMVASGLLGVTVADDYLTDLWTEVLDGLEVHSDLVLRSGGEIGLMFRKDSPQLAAAVNEFIDDNKKGTLMGNILFKRYFQSTKWAKNAGAPEDLERLRGMVGLFQQYSGEYEFDWLLVAAQGYQESGLDQSAVSSAGAVGVMQLLRSTAADPNVGIPEIEILENNIHAGVKYLRFILDRYFPEGEMDDLNRHLFAFASYNAGPSRVRSLRKKAEEEGYDPDLWFRNVEIVAAKEIGRETVQYVSNIFKYYIAYSLTVGQEEREG